MHWCNTANKLLPSLQLVFTGYHVNLGAAAAEVLHCPRCSRLVRDPHGVCGYCRENAYQCRSCRNIDYEHKVCACTTSTEGQRCEACLGGLFVTKASADIAVRF